MRATAFAVVALAAGASWYWLGGGRALAVPPPSPIPSPANVETPALATLDTAVTDAVERSFLLTPPTARALAQAWQQRGLSLDALEETALVAALHGVGALPRERADEVRRSFDGFYAALPDAERGEAGRLFAAIRDGRAQAEEIARAVALMNLGAHRMDEPAQQRLQALYSAAVLTYIAQREGAERLAEHAATYDPPAMPTATPPSRSATGGTAGQTARGPSMPAPSVTLNRDGGSPFPGAAAASEAGSKGEAYWRARAAQVRAAVPKAEARLDKAQKEASSALYSDASGCSPPKWRTILELQEIMRTWKCPVRGGSYVLRELEAAQAELDKAKKELYDLDDEARRDGALPGWLR